MWRESSSELPLPVQIQTRQKELSHPKSSPQEFRWPRKADASQERRLDMDPTPRQTLSQAIIPPSFPLRAHLSSLE